MDQELETLPLEKMREQSMVDDFKPNFFHLSLIVVLLLIAII